MSYLNKSTKDGRTYYSLHESFRDETGKVRTRHLKYLGRAKDLECRRSGEVVDFRTYGDVRAALDIVEGIGLRKIVNAAVPKGGGVRPGDQMAVLVINRLLEPCSKRAMEDWYRGTALSEMMGVPSEKICAENLCAFLDYLTDERIQRIETALVEGMLAKHQLQTDSIIFDITSTYTYGSIEGLSGHGHSRDHRPDLEQVNIGLAVTKPHFIPIMHRVFPGNVPDVVTLPATARALRSQAQGRITLIHDRGFLSEDNVRVLDALPELDFICGAKWTNDITDIVDEVVAEKLLAPLKERSKGDKLESCALVRSIYGRERKVLVYHSSALAESDSASRNRKMAEAVQELEALCASCTARNKEHDALVVALHKITEGMKCFFETVIEDHGPVNDIAVTRKEGAELDGRKLRYVEERLAILIAELRAKPLANREVRRLIRETLGDLRKFYDVQIEQYKERSTFTFKVDEEAVQAAEKYDGYFVLLSTDLGHDAAEVLDIYSEKDGVEKAFRTIKNPIAIAPLRHWEPQRVKAHIFICVVAYMLHALARLALRQAGSAESVEDALAKLAKVIEYRLEGKNEYLLKKMDEEQLRLHLIFNSQQ
jgi:transposase